MANSTFSGPIRSENGMKLISKNTTSGLISDRTLGTPIQDARRVYFDEWFLQRPVEIRTIHIYKNLTSKSLT